MLKVPVNPTPFFSKRETAAEATPSTAMDMPKTGDRRQGYDGEAYE